METRTWRLIFICLLAAAVACPAAAQAPDEKARRKFVNTAMMTCFTLENVKDTPMRCTLEQSENGPMLMVSFPDGSKLQQYAPMLIGMLGAQLCDASGATQAAGSLALVDAKLNRATVYSCEQRGFTGWIQLSRAGN
jgi:hypothetical protein